MFRWRMNSYIPGWLWQTILASKKLKTLTMYFEKEAKEIQAKEKKFVTVACAEVERQAKTLMRDATVDPNKTYGKRGPSSQRTRSAPAPDSGELMRSVTHEVTVENGEVVGKGWFHIKES